VADYVNDWLERRDGEPASDLDLVVLLVNSLDLLEEPPDRLTVEWFAEVAADVGRADIVSTLAADDLAGLRRLRQALQSVFHAESTEAAAAVLNPMLRDAHAVPELVVGADRVDLQVAPGERGLLALRARLPAALAAQVAGRGIGRLGTCASPPCECAFVDRTRAATRRFCCSICNDRAAARLYRQRRRKV
jgi:predicted RNA-binding Zn ribbon-like protein